MSYCVIQPEYIIPHYPSPCPPVSSVPASLLINSWNVRLSNEVLPLKRCGSLLHQKAYLCRDDGFIFLSAVKLQLICRQRCSKYSWERKQIASHNYLLCELWLCWGKKKTTFLRQTRFSGRGENATKKIVTLLLQWIYSSEFKFLLKEIWLCTLKDKTW